MSGCGPKYFSVLLKLKRVYKTLCAVNCERIYTRKIMFGCGPKYFSERFNLCLLNLCAANGE